MKEMEIAGEMLLTIFHYGKELADFLQPLFVVSEHEADVLLEYIEGYGNTLGCRGNEIMRLVSKVNSAEEMWQSYSVLDMVYAAYYGCEALIEVDQEDYEFEQLADQKETIELSREYHQNNEKILKGVLQRTNCWLNAASLLQPVSTIEKGKLWN